jgi:hypothetical protein
MEHERNLEYARRNEDMLRGANRHIEREAADEHPSPDALQELLCECAEACGGRISISFAEWNAVHAERNRFSVAPGHEDPAVERVLARHDRYLVVEKPASPAEWQPAER